MFYQTYWPLIAFETTCDAPYHNPGAYGLPYHAEYMRKVIGAFAHPRNYDHEKFALSVEMNLRIFESVVRATPPPPPTPPTPNSRKEEEVVIPSCPPAVAWDPGAELQQLTGKYGRPQQRGNVSSPASSPAFAGGVGGAHRPQQQQQQFLKGGGGAGPAASLASILSSVLSLKSAVLSAAVASQEFRFLLKLYSRFLFVTRQIEGTNWHYLPVDRNQQNFVEKLLAGHWKLPHHDDEGSCSAATAALVELELPSLARGVQPKASAVESAETDETDQAMLPGDHASAAPSDEDNQGIARNIGEEGPDQQEEMDCDMDDSTDKTDMMGDSVSHTATCKWLAGLAVVHRWAYSSPFVPPTTTAAAMTLAPLLALTHLQGSSQHTTAASNSGGSFCWAPDVHLKVAYHLVAWASTVSDWAAATVQHSLHYSTTATATSAGPGGDGGGGDGASLPVPDVVGDTASSLLALSTRSSNTQGEDVAQLLRAWCLVREKEQLVGLLKAAQREFRDCGPAQDYIRMMRAFSKLGVLEIARRMQQLDVASGKARQQEGAANEEEVWAASNSTFTNIVNSVVVPRFAAELGLEPEALRQWVDKCHTMDLTADEANVVAAHPECVRDLASIAQEESDEVTSNVHQKRTTEHLAGFDDNDNGVDKKSLAPSLSAISAASAEYFRRRRQYVRFLCHAKYFRKLPFFHFVGSSTELKDLQPLKTFPFWKHVLIGEFDGLLLDLRTNECLMCFEIKTNPADLAKAHDQRRKFGQALLPCVLKKELQNPAAPPGFGNTRFSSLSVGPKESLGTVAGGAGRRRHPFYDVVFPLTEEHFSARFATNSKLTRNWIIVTNLTIAGPLPSQLPQPAASAAGPGNLFSSPTTFQRNQQFVPAAGSVPAAAGCQPPPYYAPSNGKIRHVLVRWCSIATAQALFFSQKVSQPKVLASAGEAAAAARLDYSAPGVLAANLDVRALPLDAAGAKFAFSQVFFMCGKGRKAATADPNSVFADLRAENALDCIVWVWKQTQS